MSWLCACATEVSTGLTVNGPQPALARSAFVSVTTCAVTPPLGAVVGAGGVVDTAVGLGRLGEVAGAPVGDAVGAGRGRVGRTAGARVPRPGRVVVGRSCPAGSPIESSAAPPARSAACTGAPAATD